MQYFFNLLIMYEIDRRGGGPKSVQLDRREILFRVMV